MVSHGPAGTGSPDCLRIILLLLFPLLAFAQSNSIQLCDQQATRHCLSIKAPSTLGFNPTPVLVSGKSGAIIFGLASTDLSVLDGAVISSRSFISVSAATNASVISMRSEERRVGKEC
jgi:hypothetical protein